MVKQRRSAAPLLRGILAAFWAAPEEKARDRCRGRDSRVRRWSRPHPLPSEPDVHPFNASGSSIEQRLYGLRDAVAPLALGSTWTVRRQSRLPMIGGGRTYGRCRPRPICFASRTGSLAIPVRRHPREVRPLSRGVMSQPRSDPLRAGLRFLPRPLPAAPSAHLAAGLPSREDDGLTTLHRRNSRGLGPP
jgi:hypothetical protein